MSQLESTEPRQSKHHYQLMELKLRDRLRSRSIKRWHTVEIAKEQSVAEHSHLVGVIAEHLLNALVSSEKINFKDRYMVLKYAQIHDESEVILNDMSSVLKIFLKKASKDFGKIIADLELNLTPELALINEHFAKNPHLQYICMLRPEPITRFGIIRSLISGLTDHSFRFEPIVLELFPK